MELGQKTMYQIYPKSFQDTNGDGIGDIQGIIQRLDYLEDLGIDMLWISPMYPSPQRDDGYDVSDYRAINPIFGTMEDFEELVSQAKARGMDIMMDMVFNHTSTEHVWFQKALAGDKYYQDFYYLREPQADGSLPTNWQSKFGGPAWEPFADTGLYYLHLYDVTQADLNWHNPNVRKELQDIANFWLDKGVKGFRFDVLNVIGKDEELVDSDGTSSAQEKSLYTDTPIVHQWVQELNQASFGQRDDVITVGEMSSTSVPEGIKYTNPDRDELTMIFNFHHLKVDYPNGEKWTQAPVDFMALKGILNEWQVGMSDGNGWNAVFLSNHDQPREVSRFADADRYHYESATMLATTIKLLRGTPYIYQGEEIGMTNPDFDVAEDYRDVETLNAYQELLESGKPEREALAVIQQKSRSSSRTPMQWDASAHAGFTDGEPWMKVNPDYKHINVAKEVARDGILAYYKELIHLRKKYPVISQGTYEQVLADHPAVLAYKRVEDDSELLVLSNFFEPAVSINLADCGIKNAEEYTKLIGNGISDIEGNQIELGAYETIVLLKA